MYGAQSLYGSPYSSLFEVTSGPGEAPDNPEDEAAAEEIAERAAEELLDEQETSGFYDDSGAIVLPGLQDIGKKVGGILSGLGLPVPVIKKAAPKVAAKVRAKLPVKQAARAAAPRPAPRQPARPMLPRLPKLPFNQIGARITQPVNGPPARVSVPIKSVRELSQRVKWSQLAGLTSQPVTLGIGASSATTITVTRSGWVLDWSTNNNNGNVLASNLTYAQLPNTIFSPTPLSNWGPAAANPSPIDPIYVTMPATFSVTIQNINATAAEVITWQMSGIPNEFVHVAFLDPDVAAYLASVAPELAARAQAGGGGVFD